METIIENPKAPHKGRTIAGVIILVIGGILLIDQLDLVFIPHWLFSWPMLVIAFGIYTGAKHNFKNKSWLIFVLAGFAFMLESAGLVTGNLIWPVMIIVLGIYMVMKHNFYPEQKGWNNKS